VTARRTMLAVGATVVALAVGAVSVGAVPFGTAANPERIDFISRATAINNFVDVGPAGLSPGDIYVFVDDVFLASAPTERVGQALGRCTLIDPETARFGCLINTSLPGGAITTDGTLINVPRARGPSRAGRADSATPAGKASLISGHRRDLTASPSV
jgi:hypothetical protein